MDAILGTWAPPSHDLELELELELWRNLPHELLAKICSFLPLPSLLRFRRINTFFNSLPCQHDFQDLCFANSPSFLEPPHFLTQLHVDGSISSYSPVRSKWSLVPLDSILFERRTGCSTYLLASVGGLVCCTQTPNLVAGPTQYSKDVRLVIGNPLTKHKVYVPPLPVSIGSGMRWKYASLMITGSRGGELAFKLVMGVSYHTISVFDSTLNQWLTPASPSAIAGTQIGIASTNLLIMDGFCYILTRSADTHREVMSLFCVHIQSPGMPSEALGSWLCRNHTENGAHVYDGDGQLLRIFPVYDICVHMVDCKGQVGIAGLMPGGKDCNTIGIFVYDKATKSWEERWVLPEDMAEAFVGHRQQLGCATAGDSIFFTTNYSSQGILFDTSQESWSWARTCSREFIYTTIVPFYPRVDTRPQPCMG